MKRVRWGTICLLLLGLLLAFSVEGQSLDEEAMEIARDLNCPLCEGLTLADCPLEVCEQMRALIREKLAQGETREEILDYFVERYGEEVLNAPPKRGFNLTAWVLPFLVLAVGAVWLSYLLRGWMIRREEPRGEPLPSDYLERVEKELEDLG
ncbi:MAG: cytochrome c-type biogenesis protein CcmH [Anaerolineae bacterium]